MEREIFVNFDSDSCEMTDIATLRNLILDNGYKVQEQMETTPGEMGVGMTCLALLIPILPSVIKEIASILKLWSDSRHVEFEMKDKTTGRTFKIKADKASTQEMFEKYLTYITQEAESHIS